MSYKKMTTGESDSIRAKHILLLSQILGYAAKSEAAHVVKDLIKV